MADFQLHEHVTTVTFADGTTEQWRVFIDPDSGREVDRHPVMCCRGRIYVSIAEHPPLLGRAVGEPHRPDVLVQLKVSHARCLPLEVC